MFKEIITGFNLVVTFYSELYCPCPSLLQDPSITITLITFGCTGYLGHSNLINTVINTDNDDEKANEVENK